MAKTLGIAAPPFQRKAEAPLTRYEVVCFRCESSWSSITSDSLIETVTLLYTRGWRAHTIIRDPIWYCPRCLGNRGFTLKPQLTLGQLEEAHVQEA